MAVQTATLLGMQMLKGDDDFSQMFTARVHFTLPAFGGADTFTAPISTFLAAQRRNGKTIAYPPMPVCACGTGSDGTTLFYPGTLAISGGNMTGQMQNVSGSQIAGASGAGLAQGTPFEVVVSWLES